MSRAGALMSGVLLSAIEHSRDPLADDVTTTGLDI